MFKIMLFVLALVASPVFGASCNALGGGAEGAAAVNAYRAASGVRKAAVSASLTQQAQKFACDMARRGYFSHVTPEGQKFSARLRAAGYSGGCGAENIAWTGSGGGVAQALAQWKGSAPHRRNMLGRKYTVMGLAGAQGGSKTIWVLILGKCS